jgi:hypothetical protein
MDINKLSGLGSTSRRPAAAQKSEPQASDRQGSDQQPQTSERGLVPIAPSQPASPLHRSTRSSPAFLAQLIATAQHAPQTRARSRAEPADAIAHYTSAVSASAASKNWDRSV